VKRIESLAAESGSLQSYLRHIAKFPRLTVEQERELGRRIQQSSDTDALGALVESNLRFVVSYARRYRKLGVPFLDLIHEGNLGLLESARRFDPERNEPFITHAAWWVRQSIMQVLAATAGLAALQAQLEHAPAMHDVGAEMELVDEDPASSHESRAAARRHARRLSRDRSSELDEAVPGLLVQEIDDELMRDALVQHLESAMTQLDPRERQVLRLRYGLHGGGALAVQQIAQRLGISRQRVRHSESTAVQKLRRGKLLRSHLN
jgi:RNA polymerase primary sigma factor